MDKKCLGIWFIILFILSSGLYGIAEEKRCSSNFNSITIDNIAYPQFTNTTVANTSELLLPVYTTRWTYCLEGYDVSGCVWEGMEVISNNEIYTSGFCVHYDHSSPHVLTEETFHLAKWDHELNQQWNQSIIGDDSRSMTTDGEFIYTNSEAGIQKWDSDGNLIWGPLDYNEYGHNIAADSSGCIYIIGSDITTCGSCIEESRGTLTKISPSGSFSWSEVWSGNGDYESPYDVQVDEMGHVYTLSTDFIKKWDSDGNEIWSIDSTDYMTVMPDGSFYTLSKSNQDNEFNIQLYTSLGEQVWMTNDSYLGDGPYLKAAITTRRDGGLYIILQESSYGNQVHMLKYNFTGNRVWKRSLGLIDWWKTSAHNQKVWIDASINDRIIVFGTSRFNTTFDLAIYPDPSPVTSSRTSPTSVSQTTTSTSSITSVNQTTASPPDSPPVTSDSTPFIITALASGVVVILVLVLVLRKKEV